MGSLCRDNSDVGSSCVSYSCRSRSRVGNRPVSFGEGMAGRLGQALGITGVDP
jgi:hypothetical protein